MVENLVLLVENNASLRRSLEKFLSQAGYAFYSCSTAAQALNLAQKAPPGVVILEYHLPDSNGRSLIEKLHMTAPEALAILLSEYDFQAIANDLDKVKIETFLKKPFDLVDFEAALRTASAKASDISRSVNGRPKQDPKACLPPSYHEELATTELESGTQIAVKLESPGKLGP